MADANYARPRADNRVTLAGAAVGGEVRQLGDGRAAVLRQADAAQAGDTVSFTDVGKWVVLKAAGVAMLDGGRAYWDHSANVTTYRKVNDRDFYLGRVVGDAAAADEACTVELNNDPPYDLDLARDAYASVPVGTQAAGGFGYPVRLGGSLLLTLSATSEAQKADALGVDGFSPGANAVVEGAFRVISDGSGSTPDLSIGIASGTHATDASSITERLLIHLDGNATDIKVESADGTTTVALTDTTVDYTEGSALVNRVEFWLDTRDPADVGVYLNGVRVLDSAAFRVDHAAGPLFLLAHLEKTSSADTYQIAVDWLRARFAEQ